MTFARHALFMCAVAALGLAIYANAMDAPFAFDDMPNITGNPLVKDLGYFTGSPPEGGIRDMSMYPELRVRYVGMLSFALNYRLGGLAPRGYHAVNLAVHIMCALAVYMIVMVTFASPLLAGSAHRGSAAYIALASALVFVAHPLQTQAVTYIVQRLASMVALFYVLALLCYGAFRTTGRRTLYVLALACAALAMNTKENAFTLPVALMLYEALFFTETAKRRAVMLAPFFIVALMVPAHLLSLAHEPDRILSSIDSATAYVEMPRTHYLLTEFRVLLTYLRLFFLPVGQNLDYDYPVYTSPFAPGVLVSLAALIALACLGVAFLRKPRRGGDPLYAAVGFGIVWFFVTLSVESSVFPLDPIFEHRMYLPMAWMSVAAASAGALALGPARARQYVIAACCISMALAALTVSRNGLWQSGLALWQDTAQKSPSKARPLVNLGVVYSQAGDADRAAGLYMRAADADPSFAGAFFNLGALSLRSGRTDEALEYFKKAASLDPANADAYMNLGSAYHTLGEMGLAEEAFRRAVEIAPESGSALYNLAVLLDTTGRFNEALATYKRAALLDPDNINARLNMAALLVDMGRPQEALVELNRVIGRFPDNAIAFNNRGLIYAGAGMTAQAELDFTSAANLDPAYAEACNNLGALYMQAGRRELAEKWFTRALEIRPDYDRALQNLWDLRTATTP